MANLKEVRERIDSVKSTQQITKAMKLVSAAKLKRAQDRIIQIRPYSMRLSDMLSNVLASLSDEDMSTQLNEAREVKRLLIVLVTSNRGLCGAFNVNLIKRAQQVIEINQDLINRGSTIQMICIGKKGFDAFKNRKDIIVDNRYVNLLATLKFEEISMFASQLINEFTSHKYDRVECVYAQFKNAASQDFVSDVFLPVPTADVSPKKEERISKKEQTTTQIDYLFEPNKTTLLESLIPKILKTQFFRYLLDTNASDHGARMVAMDKATENANELLNELKLLYNRERQAAITGEILEIVGGAAALEA